MPDDISALIARNLSRGARRLRPELTPEQRAARSAELIQRLETEEARRNGLDPELEPTATPAALDPTLAAYALNSEGEGNETQPPTPSQVPPPPAPPPTPQAPQAPQPKQEAKATAPKAKPQPPADKPTPDNKDDDDWQEPSKA